MFPIALKVYCLWINLITQCNMSANIQWTLKPLWSQINFLKNTLRVIAHKCQKNQRFMRYPAYKK